MFASPASVAGEPSGYDFLKEENAAKWKGVFVNSLRKVNLPIARFFSPRFISLLLHTSQLCLSFFLSFSRPFPLSLSLSVSLSFSSPLFPPTLFLPFFYFTLVSSTIPFYPLHLTPASLLHFLFARTLDHFSSQRSYVGAGSINDTDQRHRLARATRHMIFQMPLCQYSADERHGSFNRILVPLFELRSCPDCRVKFAKTPVLV